MSKISALTLTLAVIRKAPHAVSYEEVARVFNKNSRDIVPSISAGAAINTLVKLGIVGSKGRGYFIRESKRSAVDAKIRRVDPSRLTGTVATTTPVLNADFHQNKVLELFVLKLMRKAPHAINIGVMTFMAKQKFGENYHHKVGQTVTAAVSALFNSGMVAESDLNYYVKENWRAFVDRITDKVTIPAVPAPRATDRNEEDARRFFGRR